MLSPALPLLPHPCLPCLPAALPAATAARWAFGIWGLIFLLEGAGVVYALLPAGYDPDGWKQRFVHSVGPGWGASWAAAAAWQLAFRLQTPGGMWLALACISAALAAMAYALAGLYRLRRQYGGAGSLLLYAVYFLPTSINAAWLSVATGVAALIAALPHYPAASAELVAASAGVAAAAAAAGLWVVLQYRDTTYGLTLVWALVAVYEKSEAPLVRHAALAGVAAMCVASLFSGEGR